MASNAIHVFLDSLAAVIKQDNKSNRESEEKDQYHDNDAEDCNGLIINGINPFNIHTCGEKIITYWIKKGRSVIHIDPWPKPLYSVGSKSTKDNDSVFFLPRTNRVLGSFLSQMAEHQTVITLTSENKKGDYDQGLADTINHLDCLIDAISQSIEKGEKIDLGVSVSVRSFNNPDLQEKAQILRSLGVYTVASRKKSDKEDIKETKERIRSQKETVILKDIQSIKEVEGSRVSILKGRNND